MSLSRPKSAPRAACATPRGADAPARGAPQNFTEFGELIYAKYFRGNEKNSNFKAGIKAIVRAAAAALSTPELKDLESSVIAVRNQKLKEEKDAQTKGKKSACAAALRASACAGGGADCIALRVCSVCGQG